MAQQTSQAEIDAALAEIRREIAAHWGWFLALGILLIIMGMAAIAFPWLSTIAAKIAIGWLFLIGGIAEIVHAFYVPRWAGVFWNLIIGVLYVLVGAWLAFFPLTGILSLTIVIAAPLLSEGIMEVVMAFRVRPHEGWGWLIFSGLIAIAAGALIAFQLPSSATWVLGLLVGINLVFTGWSFVFLALGTRDRETVAARPMST